MNLKPRCAIIHTLKAIIFYGYMTFQILAMEGVSGQVTSSSTNINIIPPSPTSVSLGKYGEYPVSFNTGIAAINIPLGELKSGKFVLPIRLDYHAGGIKVEEPSSWVGAGFSLIAGGVITRTVRGLPDEVDDGYHLGYQWTRDKLNKYQQGVYNEQEKYIFLKMVADGLWDSEPDQYYFNLNGKSGKLLFDNNNEVSIVPFQNLKVIKVQDSFVITDEGGVQYYFSASEYTTQANACDLISLPEFASTWHLMRILPLVGEEITFHYQSGITYLDVVPSSSRYQYMSGSGNCPPISSSSCKKTNSIRTSRLERITSGKALIKFNARTKRTDLLSPSSEYRLDDIEIFYGAAKRKEFRLSYINLGCKLGLSSVQEFTSSENKPPYKFDYYNPTDVPCLTSLSQDHWGFYNNGSGFEGTLVPAGEYFGMNGTRISLNGADRSPAFIKAISGTLSRITYPTNGYTSFTYEPNDYGYIVKSEVNDWITEERILEAKADPANPLDIKTFTLTHDQYVSIDYKVNISQYGGVYPSYNEYVLIKLRGGNQNIFTRNTGVSSTQQFLVAGSYTLEAYSENPETFTQVSVSFEDRTSTTLKSKLWGGVRIAEIRNHDGKDINKDVVSKYVYKMGNDSLRSSGVIMGEPKYDYNLRTQNLQSSCSYYARTSVCNLLGSGEGGHIGYREVDEIRSGGGKTHYEYTTFYDYPDLLSFGYPYPAPTSYSYLRGLMLKKSESKKLSIGYIKVKEESNTYFIDPSNNYRAIEALKVGYFVRGNNINETSFSVIPYQHIVQWVYLKSTVTSVYNEQGESPVVTNIEYNYVNPLHGLLTSIKSQNSNTSYAETTYSYPHEMVAKGKDPSGIYQIMIDRHFINAVIEEQNKQADKQVNFVKYNYFQPHDGIFAIKHTEQQSTILSPVERRLTFESYDNKGNVTSYLMDGGVPISFKWGYNQQYPVAEIKNAAPNEFYFEDFEDVVGVLSGNGHTGYKYHAGNYSLNWIVPNNREYVFSYWFLEGNVWKYSGQIAYDGSVNLTGKDAYDDIRILPKDAQMTTYTYEPLVGMTSQIDASGRTTTYEYDGFQRLQRIKDQEGKVLKKFDYHYNP